MSWQKRSIKLILGLPLSLPIVTYAIDIGDTYVQSQQNEPLNASINVTDVDPASFSVKMASSDAYHQLGLSQDSDITVHFEPTDDKSGRIVLTSNKPVSNPFTDVVLNVEYKGSSQTIPKTLLMPMGNNVTLNSIPNNTMALGLEQEPIIMGQDNQVDLPIVGQDSPVDLPIMTQQTYAQSIAPSGITMGDQVLDSQSSDTLRFEETRHVYPVGRTPSIPPLSEKLFEEQPPVNTKTAKPSSNKHTTTNNQTPTDTVIYVIQRNDNLWTIASQLAKENHKNINTVLKEIVDANPNAFPNNDPNKLKVDMELAVPRYEVMPSQLGVKAANTAKEENVRSKSKAKKATYKAAKAKRTTTTVSTKSKSANKPASRKKAEMQIIVQNQKAGSAQGNSKTANTGASVSPAINQVQKQRQITAQKANKVSSLGQNLVDAEKRLKVQNDKLAQLEQRLKELKKQ